MSPLIDSIEWPRQLRDAIDLSETAVANAFSGAGGGGGGSFNFVSIPLAAWIHLPVPGNFQWPFPDIRISAPPPSIAVPFGNPKAILSGRVTDAFIHTTPHC